MNIQAGMRLFHFPQPVRSIHAQVISTNIGKYFMSIRRHEILISPRESFKLGPIAPLPRHLLLPICIQTGIPYTRRVSQARFDSARWIN